MLRVSNKVVTALNCVFLAVGLALIAGGVYFHVRAATACQKFLDGPLLILGASVSVVSLLGLSGSCCKKNVLLGLYLFLMLLLIAGLAVFAVFVFVVTNPGASEAVSGKGCRDCRLGDFSHWLQNHFVNGKNWGVIRSCLVDARVCKALGDVIVREPTASDFLKRNFNPVQSGCCKPPANCGFDYENAPFWTVPTSGPAVKDGDCAKWSNNQDKLCYDCNSCKAGFLANIRKQWRNLAIFLICLLLFAIAVFATGCCARGNNEFYVKDGRQA